MERERGNYILNNAHLKYIEWVEHFFNEEYMIWLHRNLYTVLSIHLDSPIALSGLQTTPIVMNIITR